MKLQRSSGVERSAVSYSVYGIGLTSAWPFTWPLVVSDVTSQLTFDFGAAAPEGLIPPSIEGGVAIEGEDPADSPITIHPGEDYDVVRFRGLADHYLWPDRIYCHLRNEAMAHLVEIQLLGIVLALWLERHQVPTLHASVIVVNGRAIAFLGAPGRGKTTLATALIASGHELLVDDLVATRVVGDHVLVQPGYPMLRLWPEQADHFVGGHAAFAKMHPTYDKRLVPIGRGFGTFCKEEMPLARIFLPARGRTDREVSFLPVPSGEALLTLVANSFLHEAVNRLGMAGPRLQALSAVLSRTRLQVLRYPNGLDRLPDVIAAIEADVTSDA